MPLPHTAPAPRRPGRPSTPGLTRLRIGRGAAIALCVVAAGCTPGIFRSAAPRPSAPPAESCIARCDLQKSQCQGRQDTRETRCQEDYTRAKADHDLCVTVSSRRCLPPLTCLGADMTICDRQYKPCIADCGGPHDPRPAATADSAKAAEPELVADAAVVSAGTATAAPPGTVQTALPRTTNQEMATTATTPAPPPKTPPGKATRTKAPAAPPQPQEPAPR